MDRHVLPVGAAVMLDEPGFLDAAMATAWWVAPEDRPLQVSELCGQEGSFVLLAADGTGKTTVLRSLRAREPGAVEVNLSTLGKAEMRGKLEAAVAGGARSAARWSDAGQARRAGGRPVARLRRMAPVRPPSGPDCRVRTARADCSAASMIIVSAGRLP